MTNGEFVYICDGAADKSKNIGELYNGNSQEKMLATQVLNETLATYGEPVFAMENGCLKRFLNRAFHLIRRTLDVYVNENGVPSSPPVIATLRRENSIGRV
ncbi:hypothetical protein BV898_11233 [Hypsibius exemplaris]|uniref:Uncharacterized protein n=1 Tax=Hypsibius exemplaris TaxID=2072580 RepID=A0A1W0WH32_HYPEX|nr:hypothetical protein BV898_11233 [Hypsibius exemplaris]